MHARLGLSRVVRRCGGDSDPLPLGSCRNATKLHAGIFALLALPNWFAQHAQVPSGSQWWRYLVGWPAMRAARLSPGLASVGS